MACETGISVEQWLASDDRIVVTAIEYIRNRNDELSSDAKPMSYDNRFDDQGRQMSG